MAEDAFQLGTCSVGSVPVINHYIGRLGLDEILARALAPAGAPRIEPARSIGVLLRNVVQGRRPVYGVGDWARPFHPDVIGLTPAQAESLNDDRVGRALDALFDADRASLMTEVVVRAVREFRLDLSQIHNDSTTIPFYGAYREADGRPHRGRGTVRVAFGHSSNHRPDLKQLLWTLSVTSDGAVPIHYRVYDGNTNDSPTHRETWDVIRSIVGQPDFIYVADSKLCVSDTLAYIDGNGGRFITVVPRNHREDKLLRHHVWTSKVDWKEVSRRDDPYDPGAEADIWRMADAPVPSTDGYRVVWLWNNRMAEQDKDARQDIMAKAILGIERLETRLRNPRNRLRSHEAVVKAAGKAIGKRAARWVTYEIVEEEEASFRQETRGRPGKGTRYVKSARKRFHVKWKPLGENIDKDASTDGMFPLITNCRDMSLKDILAKYKYQPRLEKRHEQLKAVYDVNPVFLKKITRIEGLLFVYFLAMLIQALIEREVRRGMEANKVECLPIYYEERECEAPTADRFLEAFDRLEVNRLWRGNELVQRFRVELSEKESMLLRLAGVPAESYTRLE
jgi:transposase